MTENQHGYIAIISTIVMFFVLMSVALAASFTSLSGQTNILEKEYKVRSDSTVHACVEKALILISENRSYAGGDTLSLGGDSCEISSVESSDESHIISVESTVMSATTTLRVEIASGDLSIISWQEIP